eukprot:14255914-Alexandrium_andersonii.AAC.1
MPGRRRRHQLKASPGKCVGLIGCSRCEAASSQSVGDCLFSPQECLVLSGPVPGTDRGLSGDCPGTVRGLSGD